jgi:hypothetical protein
VTPWGIMVCRQSAAIQSGIQTGIKTGIKTGIQ